MKINNTEWKQFLMKQSTVVFVGAMSLVWFYYGTTVGRREAPPAPLTPHACKDYEDGYKEGSRFVINAILDSKVFLGPLKVPASSTVSNCVFLIIPAPNTGISMDGGGTNIFINNNRFWSGGISY